LYLDLKFEGNEKRISHQRSEIREGNIWNSCERCHYVQEKGYHLEAQPICILDQVRMSLYDTVTIRVPMASQWRREVRRRSAKEKCEGEERR
jgi:hypothetical protein